MTYSASFAGIVGWNDIDFMSRHYGWQNLCFQRLNWVVKYDIIRQCNFRKTLDMSWIDNAFNNNISV